MTSGTHAVEAGTLYVILPFVNIPEHFLMDPSSHPRFAYDHGGRVEVFKFRADPSSENGRAKPSRRVDAWMVFIAVILDPAVVDEK